MLLVKVYKVYSMKAERSPLRKLVVPVLAHLLPENITDLQRKNSVAVVVDLEVAEMIVVVAMADVMITMVEVAVEVIEVLAMVEVIVIMSVIDMMTDTTHAVVTDTIDVTVIVATEINIGMTVVTAVMTDMLVVKIDEEVVIQEVTVRIEAVVVVLMSLQQQQHLEMRMRAVVDTTIVMQRVLEGGSIRVSWLSISVDGIRDRIASFDQYLDESEGTTLRFILVSISPFLIDVNNDDNNQQLYY